MGKNNGDFGERPFEKPNNQREISPGTEIRKRDFLELLQADVNDDLWIRDFNKESDFEQEMTDAAIQKIVGCLRVPEQESTAFWYLLSWDWLQKDERIQKAIGEGMITACQNDNDQFIQSYLPMIRAVDCEQATVAALRAWIPSKEPHMLLERFREVVHFLPIPEHNEKERKWMDEYFLDLLERGYFGAAQQCIERGFVAGETQQAFQEKIANLTPKERRKAESKMNELEERLVHARRFEDLGDFLHYTGRGLPMVDPVEATKEVRKVLKDKMPAAAMKLLSLFEKFGLDIQDDDLKSRVLLANAEELALRSDEKRGDREVDGSQELPKEAHLLASLFYVDSRIAQYIQLARESIQMKDYDLPFSTTLRLRELQNNKAARLTSISSLLQKYLIFAINEELQHQESFFKDGDDVPSIDTEQFFRRATVEELLAYLHRAKVRFEQDWSFRVSKRTDFGSEKWRLIVENAILLVAEPNDIANIDHIFQLEHNHGLIFSKNHNLITQNEQKMRALLTKRALDTQAEVRGNTRDLVKGLRTALPGEDAFFDKLSREVDNWEEILQSIERIFSAHGEEFTVEKYI